MRGLQAVTVYGLLLFLPFSKAAIEIAAVLLCGSWLVARILPSTRAETMWRQHEFRPLVVAAMAFLAVAALSIAVSDAPALSLRGFFSKWLEYVFLCVVVADVARSPAVVTRSLTLLACSALLVLIEGFWQEITGHGLFRPDLHLRLNIFNRMTGPYENPIDLATYLMVVLPVFLTWAASTRGRRRTILWGLAVLVGLALARTQAFGAWLGLGVGVVVMFAGEQRLRRYGLVALILVILAGMFFLHRVGPGHVQHHLFSLSDMGKSDRIAMWQAALGMIRDRPLLGHGLNTFMANYLTYWVGGEQMPRYAHNCYLQMAAETGLVGLAAFLWLLGSVCVVLWQGIHRAAVEDRLILIGCLGGLSAFLAQAAIDTNFYALRQAALFWTVAGMAIGIASRTLTAPASSPSRL